MMLLLIAAGLSGIYAMAVGSFAWEDVVLGFALSSALLWVFRSTTLRNHYQTNRATLRTLLETPRYVYIVVCDILVGTWQVTSYVIGLKKLTHPGIIKIPFDEESEIRLGVGLLALTLSPGSFVVDVNLEERFILVHFIDISDPDRLREDIHRKYLHVPGTHVHVEESTHHA